MRPRAPRGLAEHYKSIDPDTVVTETLIRRLIEAGELPYYKNGSKTITTIEAMDSWLEAHFGGGAIE